NDIHEVPIEGRNVHRVVIGGGELAPRGHPGNGREDADTYRDVQRVQAGHGPVQKPEDLCLGGQVGSKVAARPEMLVKVFVVFESLDAEEAAGKEDGDEQIAE